MLEPSKDAQEVEQPVLARSLCDVGVVVIGRNEGDRLIRCLRRLPSGLGAAVYVDSGSSDGSVERARLEGISTHELDPCLPFSAARARNEGFEMLMREHPQLELVQFLDGDCEVAHGWFHKAQHVLLERPDLVAVHGRLHEVDPYASPFNRLYEMEWAAPEPGEDGNFGGNFMVRSVAFAAVGGFDPRIIAAEDDDLALRLRRAGGAILRISDSMLYHDAGMTRFSQWWRRCTRLGHAYGQLSDVHGRGPEEAFVAQKRRSLLWGLGIPLSVAVLLLPTGGLSICLLLLYPLQVARLTLRARRDGMSTSEALLWGGACVVSRFAEILGIARYRVNKLLGRTTKIIE